VNMKLDVQHVYLDGGRIKIGSFDNDRVRDSEFEGWRRKNMYEVGVILW
jgi:hypothetical protein